MEIFEISTHVVLHVYGNGLIFEEFDDVNMTLTRRPVYGVVTVLSKQKTFNQFDQSSYSNINIKKESL